MGTIKNIVIIMAMAEEARPVVELLGLQRLTNIGDGDYGREYYQCTREGAKITLVTLGLCSRRQTMRVGTQPAALTTDEAIRLFQPDLIINAGTAGGFQATSAIGQVHLSAGSFNYHDRRIEIPGTQYGDYGRGNYAAMPLQHLAEQLNLNTSIISTGNSLDAPLHDLQQIQANQAVIKEMEAAAIAEVAEIKKVPMFAMKSVTDFIDHHEQSFEQFLRNLNLATQNLAVKLAEAVNAIINQPLSYLHTHPAPTPAL